MTKETAHSPWAALASGPFRLLWAAGVLSNIGTWMQDIGAGWLMADLSDDPFMVAMVQAAITLPIFVFALFAGALADKVDRRRLLIWINGFMGAVALCLGVIVHAGTVTPLSLLALTLLLGIGTAFMAPAWQAVVPSLIPRQHLSSAIALNSLGLNISRAIGPMIAGSLIVSLGLAAPFIGNALSFSISIIALLLWKGDGRTLDPTLRQESIGRSIRAGLSYTRSCSSMKATLVKAAAFFFPATAYWALMPLIAKTHLNGTAELYGFMVGAVGLGAVGGAVCLPAIRGRLSPTGTFMFGAIGTAVALMGFALAATPMVGIFVSALAGFSWIMVLTTLHVSTQSSLPDAVRGRGSAQFLTVFFGTMTVANMVWGQLAKSTSIPAALLAASAASVLCLFLSRQSQLVGPEHTPGPFLSN